MSTDALMNVAPPTATLTDASLACGLPTTALDRLVEQLPVGVMVADRLGRLAYANAAARRLGAESLAPVRWALTRALLTEDVVCEDAIPHPEPDGRPRWIDVRAVPARDAQARVVGAVVTVEEVTARRRVGEWAPIMDSLMNL